jgi:hypothetical protein
MIEMGAGHRKDPLEHGAEISPELMLQSLNPANARPKTFNAAVRILERWLATVPQAQDIDDGKAVATILLAQKNWSREQALQVFQAYKEARRIVTDTPRERQQQNAVTARHTIEDYQAAIAAVESEHQAGETMPLSEFAKLVAAKMEVQSDNRNYARQYYLRVHHPELIPEWVERGVDKEAVLRARLETAQNILRDFHARGEKVSFRQFCIPLQDRATEWGKKSRLHVIEDYVKRNMQSFRDLEFWDEVVESRPTALSAEERERRFRLLETVLRDAQNNKQTLSLVEMGRRMAAIDPSDDVSAQQMKEFISANPRDVRNRLGTLWTSVVKVGKKI